MSGSQDVATCHGVMLWCYGVSPCQDVTTGYGLMLLWCHVMLLLKNQPASSRSLQLLIQSISGHPVGCMLPPMQSHIVGVQEQMLCNIWWVLILASRKKIHWSLGTWGVHWTACPLDTVQEEKYLWVLISEDASSLPESPWPSPVAAALLIHLYLLSSPSS